MADKNIRLKTSEGDTLYPETKITNLVDAAGASVSVATLDSNSKVPVSNLPAMTGATGSSAGTAGAVPAPAASDNTKFLRGDGTWADGGGTLPEQTGQSGKYLTTDGTNASWANVNSLPSQTGQNGKFLTTDGTDASWANVDALPSQTGNAGKYLTTDGSSASWDIPMAGLPLFYHTFQDHILNNSSWLRSDTFSWQSGDVYTSAYQHLVDDLGEKETIVTYYSWYYGDSDVYTLSETPSAGDAYYAYIGEAATGTIDSVGEGTIIINGNTWQRDSQDTPVGEITYDATQKTETIAGITITYYQATDGHKIVLADQESNVAAIFNSTGVAWYYILDTVNTRFKLPRNIYGFTGYRGDVGGYVEESLPNLEGEFSTSFLANNSGFSNDFRSGTGVFKQGSSITSSTINSAGTVSDTQHCVAFDASNSSSTYQDNAPVQQRATQAYLYFYVGNTVQNETTVDIGEMTEALNSKADTNLLNVTGTSGFRRLVEVYNNGASWYKVFDEYDPVTGAFIGKWCEQGGNTVFPNYATTIYLSKTYKDTNYSLLLTPWGWPQNPSEWIAGGAKYTDSFIIRSTTQYDMTTIWRTEGYLAIQ